MLELRCKVRRAEPHGKYYAEDYFGVGSMFNDFHSIVVHECPCCGSDDIEEDDNDEE